jgi:acyl carrier protein
MNQRLVKILADVFRIPETEVQPSLTKDDVGSWDSLKQMDLVVTLEGEYGITLEIPDILQMLSVATIINVLIKKGVNLED